MQKITISLDEIKEKLSEIERDHMEFIEFRIIPGQEDSKYIYPAFLHLDGISKNGVHKDYESIDASSPRSARNLHRYRPFLLLGPFDSPGRSSAVK